MFLTQSAYTPCVSVPLFAEYESVLKRPALLPHLSCQDIDDVLNFILSKGNLRQVFFLWRPFLKDPKDDLVLEVAVESQSRLIVIYNLRDFQGVEKFGIQAITPMDFINQLEQF